MEIDTHKVMIKKRVFFKGHDKKTPSNAVEPMSLGISVLTLAQSTLSLKPCNLSTLEGNAFTLLFVSSGIRHSGLS